MARLSPTGYGTALCECGAEFIKSKKRSTKCSRCRSRIASENWHRSQEAREAARLQRKADQVEQKLAVTT